MRYILDYANKYLQESDFKDLAMIKYCLFSTGLFTGTYIPKKYKEYVRIIALVSFIVTSVPIMIKFFKVITK